MPNRLASSSSPYLRQHADNPVDWFEWGDEAFETARERDVPVFLSVGYSSCHWCHVMAHESFEDEATAGYMNEHFVNVKVDREQRPDVDSVYMSAVQALTGQGGWPMSVFLTHDGRPFYGGTYWPTEPHHGRPSFMQVLAAVRGSWTTERAKVLAGSDRITDHLRHAQELGDGATVDTDVLDSTAERIVAAWDRTHGGFGRAPKFPQAMSIDFLLAHHQRTGDPDSLQAAVHSLEKMTRGGIYDHVGGGFARYSVDERWLVPHFEKMLYDNALLLRALVHAWQMTGLPRFERVARDVAEYLIRDMQQPEGGFSSATDADSEGVEGKFFVWTAEAFDEAVVAVGEDPARWRERLGVTVDGNWTDPHGHAPPRANILHEVIAHEEDDPGFARRWAAVRQSLRERRDLRVAPGLDDKVLVSWNALAIAALAEAGAVLQESTYVEAAQRAAYFIADHMTGFGIRAQTSLRQEWRRPDGLLHTWSPGHAAEVPALLEDLALLARALLMLFEADGDPRWVDWATMLAAQVEADFADGEGAYYATGVDGDPTGPDLLLRPLDLWDNAQPSGSSVMVEVNVRLAALTGDQAYRDRAVATVTRFGDRLAKAPLGYGELAVGAERLLAGPVEVALVGGDVGALASVVRETWRPGVVLAIGGGEDPPSVPLLRDRPTRDDQPTAYVCRGFVCDAPTTEPGELAAQLSAPSA
ncbi:thioredoxin domain-containing protein [Euzebya tangerina]|uniref:thioredoxin domain-containing protein n=1 Tax=Euzebya tangerina TaxID=591198 RepID=UPI000E31CB4A|nr:thioredoxin domain-containing protein [Euzebya tangerina]